MAAYAHHAYHLNYKDDEVRQFYKAMNAIGEDLSTMNYYHLSLRLVRLTEMHGAFG